MDVDLALVLGYFRSATSFLSIIKELAPRRRIVVVVTRADASMLEKTAGARERFLQLCHSLGADVVPAGVPVRARMALVQQYPYSDEVAEEIRKTVQADKYLGLLMLATAGLPPHDRFLTQFAITKAYVPSRRLMLFLLEHRNAAAAYERVDVEEVGLPFGRHPLFSSVAIDWLIAAPTLFSFRSESSKHEFLEAVLRLLAQIPSTDVVAYKPHNGNALDYFAPRLHYAAAEALAALGVHESRLRAMAAHAPPFLRRHIERVLTGMLHKRVLLRASPLAGLTEYADLGLEAFLPGVRKGVIGGLSNTIWGTLYFGLPYYNCVDRVSRDRTPKEVLRHKDPGTLLDLNIQFFGVPYCGGDLSRGAKGQDIVTDADRAGDLVASIQTALDDHRDVVSTSSAGRAAAQAR